MSLAGGRVAGGPPGLPRCLSQERSRVYCSPTSAVRRAVHLTRKSQGGQHSDGSAYAAGAARDTLLFTTRRRVCHGPWLLCEATFQTLPVLLCVPGPYPPNRTCWLQPRWTLPSPAHVRIPLHTKLHLVVASGFFVQGSPGNGSAQPTSAAIAVFRATSTDLNVLSYSPANFARNRLLPAHLVFQSSRPACVSSIARAPSLRFLLTAANPTVPMARCALLDPLPMALALPAFQTSLCPRPQIHRSTPPATCAASMPCASAPSWSSKRPRRTSSSTSLST